MALFTSWRLKQKIHDTAIVGPDERLPWPEMIMMGMQHVIAMFGATILAPMLMGFDANLAILMSGIGTLIFFVIVRGRIPSYLGSSFAFIGVVIAATGYSGAGPNNNLSLALGGIFYCGLVIALIGLIVQFVGVQWIERLMPPVVTGAVVAVIGLNLAPIAVKNALGASSFDAMMALITIALIALVAVFTRGMVSRLLILVGLLLSYCVYVVMTNGLGFGTPIDFTALKNAQWFGVPHTVTPSWDGAAISLIVPVALILIAENLGHIKAVSAMTGHNFDKDMGRAFMGDGCATMISSFFGGTGVTTYAENIGVMAVTKIYSTLVFVIAGIMAILLGFSPKFGALIQTIPLPIMGGVSIVVFGLIAVAGAKIWVENKVDFSINSNLIVASVTLILGAGDFVIHVGALTINGIGTATFGAIILYALLGRK